MVFRFFRIRRDLEDRFTKINNSLNSSFSKIKEDMQGVGEWIKQLDETKKDHHSKLKDIESRLAVIEEFMNNLLEQSPVEEVSKQLSKQRQTNKELKQTVDMSKQLFLEYEEEEDSIENRLFRLTPMERAIFWSLLNTDLWLSYEDLSRILGKDNSTVRGQINNIKKKVPGLVKEQIENSGKKRFYIEEEKKRDILLKYTKKKLKKAKSES